jgi:hypothetical protein
VGGHDTDRSFVYARNQGHRGPHHFIEDVFDMVLGLEAGPARARSSSPDAVP